MKTDVAAIVGPTASGKTALSIALAKKLNGEIISADSMQIYKGMDIASAKPSESEKEGIEHHLMDFLSPFESYSVANFVEDAKQKIFEVAKRGHFPIIVGGTGLYVNSLLDNVTFSKSKKDEAYRKELEILAEKDGSQRLYNMLLKIDEPYAKTLHPNNTGRVIRALELYKTDKITMTEQLRESRKIPSPFNDVRIGIAFKDRQKLYDRINLRVDKMMSMGLLQEAEKFLSENPSPTALQAIGIKEMSPYIKGLRSLDCCIESLKQATRNYAKRQITWFKKDEKIKWLYADEMSFSEMTETAFKYIRES